jgi:hypothetical protein
MGLNWLESGPSLPGDFIYNGIVDLNDLSYFSHWWLHDCFDPPIDICPDCVYPDCNLTDCNAPMTNPCPSCETTPRYIKVSFDGSHGCGCACELYEQGSVYVDPNHSIDGNYIVPYGDLLGVGMEECVWSGIYSHSFIIIRPYYNGDCCVYPADPYDEYDRYDKVLIRVERLFDNMYVNVYLWNIYWERWEWQSDLSSLAITNLTNCVEGSGTTAECGDYGPDPRPGSYPPIWGDNGTITVTLPWESGSQNMPYKAPEKIKEKPIIRGCKASEENQTDLIKIQKTALDWLEMK